VPLPARLTLLCAASLWALVVVRAAALAPQTPPTAASPDPPTRSVLSGVYTDAQAERGAALYADACEHCHGKSLEGDRLNDTEPLAGADFLKARNGQDLGRLYRQIITRMPDDDPGSLTPQDTADVITYILKFNGFPAGKDELPSDGERLKLFRLEAKNGPRG
jgi:cytochrome c